MQWLSGRRLVVANAMALSLLWIAAAVRVATAMSAELLRDINDVPTVLSSDPAQFDIALGRTFFRAATPQNGRELWQSDGTADGTQLLADLNPGPAGSAISCFAVLGDEMYFTAQSDADVGRLVLWRSDGSSEGAAPLAHIEGFRVGDFPCDLVVSRGRLYFLSFAPADHGYVMTLWKRDGTDKGTRPVRAFDGQRGPLSSTLAASNGIVFFSAESADAGREPWRSDGTASGTRRLRDIADGRADSAPFGFTAVGRRVCFTASDGAANRVWCSDGSQAGTRAVLDGEAYPPSPVIGGRFFVNATVDGEVGRIGSMSCGFDSDGIGADGKRVTNRV